MLRQLYRLVFIFLMVSCSSSELELPEDNTDPTILTITEGMNFIDINKILYSATSGDTVEVEAGTYTIEGELAVKEGTTLRKKSNIAPIFTAVNSSKEVMLEQYWGANKSDINIIGIEFHNIRIKIEDASNTHIRDCIFDYGKRKKGTTKSFTQDAYIQFNNCTDMLVEKTVFKRRLNNSGRGIYIIDCTNTKILNNHFGNGDNEGYFVTAINDNSNKTEIIGNTIKRTSFWEDTEYTDHGVYVHSFNDISIISNTISGWPANSSGGSIKIRNGENALIESNTLVDSGILMYVYDNTPNHPFLKNIEILNNEITIDKTIDDIYHGIGYWRNTSDSKFYEESIKIIGNSLINGVLKITKPVNVDSFNKNGGGVYNNEIAFLSLPLGVNNSGNH